MIEPCLILNTDLSRSPNTDNPVNVLPDPDSPTIPRISPWFNLKLILFNNTSFVCLLRTVKFLTSSIFMMILSLVIHEYPLQ